jgi:uncharacterized protein with HEPN domain
MRRSYRLYLEDILSAMESVQLFVKGMSCEEFESDDIVRSAVVRKFEIIGEATKQVPEEMRLKYPQVPWRRMAGMRDKLVHFYFGVDYRLVWRTIKEDIPKAKPQIQRILDERQ